MQLLLGAGLSSVLLKYPNAFFDGRESQVCLFTIHTGDIKPGCSCTRIVHKPACSCVVSSPPDS